MMKYDVIVVGAGLAGLTASLKLAKSGKKVALFEKHSVPGGYATNFKRKGKDGNIYTFDVSLHSLSGMNKDCTTYNILNGLGVLEDLEILKKSEPSVIIKKNKEKVYIPNDVNEYKKSLMEYYPNFKNKIESLFDFMKNFYNGMINVTLNSKPREYDQTLEHTSLHHFLKNYVDNETFIEDFSYLWGYAGLPPSKINAFFSMEMISSYIIGGHSYIRGGSGHLTKVMKEHIEKCNSDVYLSSEVLKINSKDNKIISITTNKNETFEANEFIFACDPNHIFSLIDDSSISNHIKNLSSLEKSSSILQLYLGLNSNTKKLDIESSHIFVNNTNHDIFYNNVENGIIDHSSNFLITAYDQMDPTLNEHGAFLNAATLDFGKNWPERGTEEYKNKKQKLTNLLLDKILKIYPKIENHIQVIELGTPKTMTRYTNNTSGSIYGWSQNLKQGGFKRTSFKTPFDNAIVVGAWSYPGGGYEGAMFSGFIGANRLLSKKSTSNNFSNKLISLDKLMNGLVSRFNPENAEGIDVTYKFIFDEHAPIYLEVKNQTAILLPKFQTPEKVDTTLTTTHEVWQKICFKELSGQDALMDGLITCEGNMRNFASIPKMFNKSI